MERHAALFGDTLTDLLDVEHRNAVGDQHDELRAKRQRRG